MAAPVNPNGSIPLTIEIGRTLTVTGEAGAKGTVAIFNNGAAETVDSIVGGQSKTYGPYTTARSGRLYAEAGKIDFQFSSSLSALPAIAAPTISADGKTVFGTGVKPATTVPIYNADTGVPLGQAQSLADGSWSVSLKTALAAGTRIGFDPVIVGPYATVPASAGGSPATGSAGTLDYSDPANSGLHPAT